MNEYFKMTVNGYSQQMFISGDESKPVLLFCHGGPGTPTISMLKKWSKPLFEDFLVATWDQRGTGRSFTKDLDRSTIHISTIVKDTHEITAYLKERFNREKIFIMGHSFGATLAMQVIKERPEDYLAYFGISQFVNTTKNEAYCYDFVMSQAKKYGHDSIVQRLEQIGPPVDGYYKNLLKDLAYVKQLVGKYKGDNTLGNAIWRS